MNYSRVIINQHSSETSSMKNINVSDYLALETESELISLATDSSVLYADDTRKENDDNFECFTLSEIASKEA